LLQQCNTEKVVEFHTNKIEYCYKITFNLADARL